MMMKVFRNRAVLALLLTAGAIPATAEEVYIQVKTTTVRKDPKFYAPKVAALAYGDSVTKLEEAEGWAKITKGKTSGYIPVSSLTPQRIVFSDREVQKVSADSSDIVLAGKGFSPEVEAKFKQQGNAGRYDLVDKVEKQCRVDDKDLAVFVKVGGLKG